MPPNARDIRTLDAPIRTHEDERRRARRAIARRATDVGEARWFLEMLDLFPTEGEQR